ncbi:MAG: trypsin-like peptidase domain-containing protein [Candidatus Magasanikbacteria bacterium]|nr:trypsin-like peptidase domain-containing protein [Candidatus Magasanikbacteria bacterium]
MSTEKKVLFLGIFLVALGLALNLFPADRANANLWQNLFDQYLKPLVPRNNEPAANNFSLPEEKTGDKNEKGLAAPPPPAPAYLPTVNYEQVVIKAVENASPAVVSIIISKDVPIIENCPFNPFSDLPPEFQDFFGKQFEFSQPCEKGTRREKVGGGSGFIITSDGLVVTNKHVVVDEKASYTVFTNDGKKYSAEVLARDPAKDLAVIKINAQNLSVLTMGDSNSLKLGQTVIAIGNALGEFRNTVSVGAVSGLSRGITASGAGLTERIEGLIQTDAAINPGNSGGPLLNLKGEVIGVNTAVVSGAQNIGFAIPVNQIKKAVDSVKQSGKIVSPYIGVRYLAVTPDLAEKEGLKIDAGALLRGNEDGPAVLPGSPADKAGLKAEDIILEINSEKVTLENSLSFLLQKYNVHDTISLKILRAGKEMVLRATLEERPKKL